MQDAHFAACLIIDNQKEIALAEFAAEHAQHEQVKQFAQRMVQEHQQLVQQLQDAAATGGFQLAQLTVGQQAHGDRIGQGQDRRTPGAVQDPNARADAQNPTDATRRAARPDLEGGIAGRQGEVSFIAIKQEIAEECLKSAQQELTEKSGAEFDQCYMFGQVMAHTAMADALKVFARHASPELQQILQKGQQVTQDHLAEAQQIAEQLDQDQGRENRGQRDREQRKDERREDRTQDRENRN